MGRGRKRLPFKKRKISGDIPEEHYQALDRLIKKYDLVFSDILRGWVENFINNFENVRTKKL